MQTRTIGQVEVSAVGLGGMPMSIDGRPDRQRSLATLHASFDAGVTLVDTADAYCLDDSETGHNEELVAEALRTWGGDRDAVLVATKGGHTRPGGSWAADGRPEHLHEAARASARRLGVEAIGLYQFHRPDPDVPYAESLGALVDLLDAGVIRMAGISNADVDQVRQAQEVLGGRLASVQNQYSPGFRSSQDELDLCAQMGVAFLPWSPLGGISKAADLGSSAAAFAQVADEVGATPQQVALAWELRQSAVVVPIPGSSRPETARASVEALDLALTDEQFDRLQASSSGR